MFNFHASLYRMLPDSTIAFAHDQRRGTKKIKNRVSFLLAASMTGEKKRPVVIGKYKQPHCFKGVYFCLSLSAAFMQPGDHLLAKPCISRGTLISLAVMGYQLSPIADVSARVNLNRNLGGGKRPCQGLCHRVSVDCSEDINFQQI